MNLFFGLFLIPILVFGMGWGLLWYLNFRPAPIVEESVHNDPDAPTLSGSRTLRILTYNVQYLAGTKYSFFYDGGPDTVASESDVNSTMKEVAEFILAVDADFVLLQEVDVNAKRSSYVDQIGGLRAHLSSRYPAFVSSYYWWSRFVPHPKVWGPVGMKMLVFSKYELGKAYRHRLAQTPGNPLNRDFNIKRAFLEVMVPLRGGTGLILINTHLEAFTKGTDVLQLQVEQIRQYLKALDARGIPWILGGDFNALPPGQFECLPMFDRGSHSDRAELQKLFKEYQGVPSVDDATGASSRDFFTFTARDGISRRPIRTLDYLFVSPLFRISEYFVEQDVALKLSDHLPVIAEFGRPRMERKIEAPNRGIERIQSLLIALLCKDSRVRPTNF
jgi:endonuclease/exonuclease/phosphatase family metal-dependent hydrolase